jgi:hypothetical protein
VLWLLNPSREAATVSVSVDGRPVSAGQTYWPGGQVEGSHLTVPPRDVLVMELQV